MQEWAVPKLLHHKVQLSEDAVDLLRHLLRLNPAERFNVKDVMRHPWVDAAKVRGSVQAVAATVKRREHHVLETRKNVAYLRKARKRGLGPCQSLAPESDIFT